MTVATIFGDTADDWISSSSTTYANARAGTGSSATGTTIGVTTWLQAGQERDPSVGGGASFCYEGFISFDTSSIGGGSTVTVVTLDLWLTTDLSTDADFTLNARDFNWGSSVTTSSFVAGAGISANTLLASIATSGIGSAGAYKTLTSQAAFLTASNIKTGTVHILLSSSRHEAGTAPALNTQEYLALATADNTGTTNDPKLTITYTASTKSPPPFQNTTQRVWRTFQ